MTTNPSTHPPADEQGAWDARRALTRFGVEGLVCSGALVVLALRESAQVEVLGLLFLIIAGASVAAVGADRGHERAARLLFSSTFLAAAVAGMFLFGGNQTSAAVPVVSAVALAGVLLGRSGLLVAMGVAITAAVLTGWGAAAGWLPQSVANNTPLMAAGGVVANIVMVGVVFMAGADALAHTRAGRERARRRLVERDRIDPVSTTLSLTALREEIGLLLQEPDRREAAALLVVALDHGSLIRRGFGHGAQGSVLRAVADRLRGVIRPHDRIARFGDEQFAVLAPRVGGLDNAVQLAERIVRSMKVPVNVDEDSLVLKPRLGLVSLDGSHTDADAVLRDGSAALAAAGGGTNIGVFEAGVVTRARRALQLDADLERAIAARELVAWYQPVVSLVDGRLEGFEALVRWPRGESVVPPADFLPRAEATGAIVAIDRLVLEQACEQLATWGEQYPDLTPWVAVNLSAAQFETVEIVDVVASALQRHGVAPERLHLELTESTLTADAARTRRILDGLRALGVVLALDDFGTGWSSLRYIQDYPVHVVKIDRSFIATIDGHGGQELAATVVFMAQQLGLDVVGEGIETRAQYRVLRNLGVHAGQGYHFSRPVPAARAVRYLRPWLPEEPSRPWSLSLIEGAGGS